VSLLLKGQFIELFVCGTSKCDVGVEAVNFLFPYGIAVFIILVVDLTQELACGKIAICAAFPLKGTFVVQHMGCVASGSVMGSCGAGDVAGIEL